ncbi:MAG: glycosyltransferase [Acinetobacter populi]|jgi:glycosyltransferase involved in cell wall biosynthesis|uniref:glycosyltransferase n=1 Tax=Acinetobacter populi TaxID=1582270 RepID=UPI002355AB5C|nr:glycosyltransferase [Acinetobacter populi]MCH4248685.1 glycosyltransferase [Acinetobacter populi]
MKILHAAETIKGGVATVINSLVDHQTKLNRIEQVSCLIPSDQIDNLNSSERLLTFTFNRNGRSLIGMISFALVFLKILLKEKPDVVHLHSSFAGLIGRIIIVCSLRKSRTKVIYCPHAFGFLMQTSKFKQKIYIWVEKFLSIFTDKIICVSQSEYNCAIKYGFSKENLIVIHNGVKIKDKTNKRNLNHKSHYKILFVGRFDYQKGIDILAGAISLLCEKPSHMKYEFTLVGESVNSNEKVFFKQNNNVKINELGWLKPDILEEQYLTHDILVIPSRWEGFAMVPLEAMSYGLPIIASNIDAFRELKQEDKPHILYFESDMNNLYQIFTNLEYVDLEEYSTNSLDLFKQKYTDEIMLSNTLNCYKH